MSAEAERRAAIAAGTTPALYRSTRLADVVPERVEWLWSGRLPRRKLVVLDGDPSVGKSTLMLDLVARITTGRPMPGETFATVLPSDVVLLAAEDGLADTIRPRLDAAGADCARVHHLDAVPVIGDEGTVQERPPVIPGDADAIEALVTETGAVLVIVDVLMAYLDGRNNSYRDQDVRSALAPLVAVAERTGATVVVLRHLTKSPGGAAIYRGGGSIGAARAARAARAALLAAVDPDDESGTLRVLALTKSNLGPPPPAMGYSSSPTTTGDAPESSGSVPPPIPPTVSSPPPTPARSAPPSTRPPSGCAPCSATSRWTPVTSAPPQPERATGGGPWAAPATR